MNIYNWCQECRHGTKWSKKGDYEAARRCLDCIKGSLGITEIDQPRDFVQGCKYLLPNDLAEGVDYCAYSTDPAACPYDHKCERMKEAD